MDFAQPSQDLDVKQAGFFANFANCSLFRGFAGFNMPFRDSPAPLGVLNQQNINVILFAISAKDDSTRSRLAHYFLNGRFFKDTGRKPRNGVCTVTLIF